MLQTIRTQMLLPPIICSSESKFFFSFKPHLSKFDTKIEIKNKKFLLDTRPATVINSSRHCTIKAMVGIK